MRMLARRVRPIALALPLVAAASAGCDIVTADLDRVTLNSAGAIRPTESATTTIEPLIVSSPQTMAIDAEAIRLAPDPARLIADFAPGNEAMTLAARVTGPVGSAFPDGPPEGVEAPAAGHLAEAKAPLNLILVADSDLAATSYEGTARFFGDRLVIRALPFEVRPLELHLMWHPRQNGDPFHRWLREHLLAHAERLTPRAASRSRA